MIYYVITKLDLKVAGKDKGEFFRDCITVVLSNLVRNQSLKWSDKLKCHNFRTLKKLHLYMMWKEIYFASWALHQVFWKKKEKQSVHKHVVSKSVVKWVMHKCGIFASRALLSPRNNCYMHDIFWGFRGMRNVCFLVLCLFIHHLSILPCTYRHTHTHTEPRAWSAGPPKGNRW